MKKANILVSGWNTYAGVGHVTIWSIKDKEKLVTHQLESLVVSVRLNPTQSIVIAACTNGAIYKITR